MASEAQIKANRENAQLAGRPVASATLIKQKFREALAKKIDAEAEAWITAIKDAALGHFMEVKQKDGSVKVYKTKPDPLAWQKAMDRAFGSPEQAVDVLTGGEKIGFTQQDFENLIASYESKRRAKDSGSA